MCTDIIDKDVIKKKKGNGAIYGIHYILFYILAYFEINHLI